MIVLAVGLWSSRSVRMWLEDNSVREMTSSSGHVYMANFIGVEHQVLHDPHARARDVANNTALGDYEVTLFIRCATFRHMRCSNACRLWNEGDDGRLCKALCLGYGRWYRSSACHLLLPSLADLLAADATWDSEQIRPKKKAKRVSGDAAGKPTKKKRPTRAVNQVFTALEPPIVINYSKEF